MKNIFKQKTNLKKMLSIRYSKANDSIEIIISSKLIFIYYFKYIATVFIFLNNKYLKYDMMISLDKQLIRF